MIKIVATFVSIIMCFACVAQRNDFKDTVYFFNSGEITKKKYADVYRVPATKDSNRYKVSYFRMDGSLIFNGSYIPRYLKNDSTINIHTDIADGYFEYYNDKSHKTYEGEYKLGEKYSTWKYYSDTSNLVWKTEDYYDEQPVLYVTFFNDAGKKIKEGLYYNIGNGYLLMTGTWTFYYNNTDAVCKVLNFKDDKLTGEYLYYDSITRKKAVDGRFNNNLKTGRWRYYNVTTGKISRVENYADGLLHGDLLLYDNDTNKPRVVAKYEFDYPIGDWKIYFKGSDSLVGEVHYNKQKGYGVFYDSVSRKKILEGKVNEYGQKYGKWVRYYPGTDIVKSNEEYANNLLHGTLIEYSIEGNIISEGNFHEGRKNGKSIIYHDNKKIWLELFFYNDSLNGELKSYYYNGNIKRIENYGNGKLLSSTCYDELGNEIPYTVLRAEPQFPTDVMTYIGDNLNYPQEVKDSGLEGKVLVGFIINENGTVSDVTIIKGFDSRCDEEAVRLVSQMPPWTPAQIDGKPFKTYQTLPIVFWIH